MKYFVIHSGSDQGRVKDLIHDWTEKYDNIQFVLLQGGQTDWVGDAVARIRECRKILYLVGQTSAASENIQLELDIARRENKDIYVFCLAEGNRINPCLKDGKGTNALRGEYEGEVIFSKTRSSVQVLDQDALDARFQEDSQEVERILRGRAFADKDMLMEQYKLFVQTSEDLVGRKQSVNTFYVTLNSLMLSAVISIVCAAGDILQTVQDERVIYVVSAFLSVIGMVICCSWTTLLSSYADLNASKMAIIGCIEERLALKLFDTEWALLTRRIGKRKYRSFTVKELGVARVFMALYAVMIVACLLLCFLG